MNTDNRIHQAYWELTMLLFLDEESTKDINNALCTAKKQAGFLKSSIREALCEASNSLNLLAEELDVDFKVYISIRNND